MIRVGTIKYTKGGQINPSYPGFTPIIVLTKSSAYGSLGPYVITVDSTDIEGYEGENYPVIFENLWQFGKIYETVPKSTQRYSRFDNTVIWNWPAERHVNRSNKCDVRDYIQEDDTILPEYWKWREAGMKCNAAVRYPVGKSHTSKCICYLTEKGEQLNYVQARCLIYCRYYINCVKSKPQFKKLKDRLNKGENLLIIEVDGPRAESMDYYMETYGVPEDWIQDNTILINEDNLNIMLTDTKHAFGHGYCLAMALLDYDIDVNVVSTL